ncbi:hypothetical protein QMZ05_08930 [Bradyrhizobium sp. INPA03-11B]|uniref:hypothetical protein n=1 Tax=Bradyrhizobium sp. INPA03-11B TaxID=418598 RepID=UPI00338E0D38
MLLSSYGCGNCPHHLERLIPNQFSSGPFVLFPSNKTIQSQADEFLFHCGIVEKAETLRGWLAEDLVSARLENLTQTQPSGIKHILVLKATDPSLYAEIVARAQRKWLTDVSRDMDRAWEEGLERRHMSILPELTRRVDVFQNWGIRYTTTTEIDRYFDEWGQLYLRRMWSHDLIGPEEKLGGNQFNEYLGVLAAISGRCQKHLCFTGLLRHKHPHLDWRNLLTTFAPFDEFLVSLARHLDADRLQLQQILSSLTLEPSNKDAHLQAAETAWAPIVRSNQNNFILPAYGLEINPFLFLLRDLQNKYPQDWFEIANNREKRWRRELNDVFLRPRWTCAEAGIPLRDERRVMTDIDALVYDHEKNEIGLFQLKWQQPVGPHGRGSRSAAKNLVVESNKWITQVSAWLSKYGTAPLLERLGASPTTSPHVILFVLGRYNAQFAGKRVVDQTAVWADWAHFIRAVAETTRSSLSDIEMRLRSEAARIRADFQGESYVVPLDDMAVIFNPSQEPEQSPSE